MTMVVTHNGGSSERSVSFDESKNVVTTSISSSSSNNNSSGRKHTRFEVTPHPPSPPPSPTLDDHSPKIPPKSPIKYHDTTRSNSSSIQAIESTSHKRDTSSISFQSPKLRSNLMRQQKERDPLFCYEVVKTLGVGSMGSVAKVRKRQQTVGGSARKDIQDAVKKQKRNKQCLQIPIIGGLFRLCIDDNLNIRATTTSNHLSIITSSLDVSTSSTNQYYLEETGNTNFSHSKSSMLIPPPPSHSSGDSVMSGSSMGATSQHSTGTGLVSSIEYAMKSIHLSRVTDDTFITELKNEISILKELDHPHIVRAMETFEHRNQIFIVMELCSGGDLYSRDPYTEEQAARIVSSILSAIAYMHSKNIAHRDLKYENILFVSDSPTAEIKLIDFGLSKVYGDDKQLTEGVGTIYTMAPEVLKGNYTQKADIWSIGVITYMLLSSQMPFYGRKRRHIVEQVLNCQYDFRGRRWKRISGQAKSFIEDLLVFDPEDRLDATSALGCTWLNKRFAATTRGPQIEEETMARNAMLRYAGYTKLKRMALMVVAHKSTCDEIGILRKVFQKYDKNRDGSISYEQFCEALKESGHSTEDMRTMFEAVDLDGTGRIRYTEFLAATIEAQGAISEERLAEAFDRLDSDDSGYISAENLAEILGEDFPKEEIDEIIKEADLTKDNRISYAEFLALWEQKHEEDRANALEMLGDPSHASSLSLYSVNELSSRYSELSMNPSMDDSAEEREAAKARASFIMEKHNDTPKHVNFVDTIIAIKPDDKVEQQIMDDEVFNEEDGIHL